MLKRAPKEKHQPHATAQALLASQACISADFKTTFAALEAKLDCTQAVVTEHGQRIDSLESGAERQDQRIQTLPSPPKLDRAQRALTAMPQSGSRPRPVIIRLHRYQIKEMIVREARKRRGDLQYRGSQITLPNGAKKKLASPEEAATFMSNYQQRPDTVAN
ncbi:hypothetical protein DPEC_G00110070 [Dallia pectoralis]|uniref:Uncharacterized protein n=1 Tax=Dallia pectoralis TaxID=75939 RepID=A0ACC2GTE9_DALPE|nr:hypothetical protein DPEC_G00110070 [Dallia pectoralis]